MIQAGDAGEQRWHDIDLLFDQLLDMGAGERDAALARICTVDRELEAHLRRLLTASSESAIMGAKPPAEFLRAALDDGASDDALPSSVGPYRVILRLGRGGMGTVYLAERDDPELPNRIALKLLRRGVDTDDVIARFRRERRILASLNHPGIARVHDAGTSDDGRPWLAMEYVDGSNITAHCKARQLDMRARVELFMAAARAVAYAHEHGVVHRDLKPSNILVTAAESQVKLLDFGIAKLTDANSSPLDSEATRSGARVMTPAYASPEQSRGDTVGVASDIYQLGLLLHELLTGQLPFAGELRHRRPLAAASSEPETPSHLVVARSGATISVADGPIDEQTISGMLRGNLDSILLRCLRSEPAARYGSVMELHEDLLSHLHGRPVAALKATAAYRLRRYLLRRKSVVTGIAVTAALALVVTGVRLAGGASRAAPGSSAPRWVAASGVHDATGRGDGHVAAQVDELLQTSLARAPDLQLISISADDTNLAALSLPPAVQEVVTGVLRISAAGTLELLLRRHSLPSGVPFDSVVVAGADPFELVDRASSALLRRYGVNGPVPNVSSVTTLNPESWRLYVEGLTAFRSGDSRVADRFFRAALQGDSSFALAAYYAARTTAGYDRHASFQLMNRAATLAGGTSLRDRLTIQAYRAHIMSDPVIELLADSLTRLFPAHSNGHFVKGRSAYEGGRFMEAAQHYEVAVSLDSLSLGGTRSPCIACDALDGIVRSFRHADSLSAGVRMAERWTRLQPHSARSWDALASSFLLAGQFDESLEARLRAASLRLGNVEDLLYPGIVALYRGEFADADRVFRVHASGGSDALRRSARWWLAISLRHQGRFSEAIRTAQDLIALSRQPSAPVAADLSGIALLAQSLLEVGRAEEAGDEFARLIEPYEEYSESRQARNDAWFLTQIAESHLAAGDTATAATLADSIESAGARSSYARDRRLHYYVRARLARERGASEQQVEQLLRSAIYSLSNGYTRINHELATTLMNQRRYGDAVSVAAASLRNSVQANGLYSTRSTFHELLGKIWEAAGNRDSAIAHYSKADLAWRNADPVMDERRDRIRRSLAQLRQGPPGY